jgi:D-glycerate 3-kinase
VDREVKVPAVQTEDTVAKLINLEGLPPSYRKVVDDHIMPLATRILAWQQDVNRPLILGLHGAQGTGKSTLALFLKALLSEEFDCSCVHFSLDDLYLTRAEREGLAVSVHPLLKTRGVPGTHDLLLGDQVIESLLFATPDHVTRIPAFDKASDDRLPKHDWPTFQGRPKVILIEGWCLGARPERDPDNLAEPVNVLEEREDRDNGWRVYVNDHLWDSYAWFFDQIDRMIMLKAPSMESVIRWRTLQEHKLAERLRDAPEQGASAGRVMGDKDLLRFIMHYERLTRRCLYDMPRRADVVFHVDENHQITKHKAKEQEAGDWLR